MDMPLALSNDRVPLPACVGEDEEYDALCLLAGAMCKAWRARADSNIKHGGG
jgi:hypothetical protein